MSSADLTLFVLAFSALPPAMQSVTLFAGGATLMLFKYSRPGGPRRVRDRHNVDTAKAWSIFKLKFLTSP